MHTIYSYILDSILIEYQQLTFFKVLPDNNHKIKRLVATGKVEDVKPLH